MTWQFASLAQQTTDASCICQIIIPAIAQVTYDIKESYDIGKIIVSGGLTVLADQLSKAISVPGTGSAQPTSNPWTGQPGSQSQTARPAGIGELEQSINRGN
jgi:hypothetical protein